MRTGGADTAPPKNLRLMPPLRRVPATWRSFSLGTVPRSWQKYSCKGGTCLGTVPRRGLLGRVWGQSPDVACRDVSGDSPRIRGSKPFRSGGGGRVSSSSSSAIWSRSARRPCAGCRSRGRVRGRSPRRVAADAADEYVVDSRRLPGTGTRRGGSTAPPPESRVACSAESGSSVSIQIASAWPTITGTRTHVAWIGRSGSSMIFCVSARSFDSSSNSSPSNSQSIRRSCSAGSSFASRSIAGRRRPRRTGRSRRARARGRQPRAAASARR